MKSVKAEKSVKHVATVEERLALVEDILFAHEHHNDEPHTCCQAGDCSCAEAFESTVGQALSDGVLAAVEGLTQIAEDPDHQHRLVASESLLNYTLALVDRS